MKSFIQFITVPTADTPGTALYLHFDNKRYLVGQIGEGTQRACVQNGTGLKKVEDVFITGRTDNRSLGGLIGLMLTLADVVAGAKANLESNKKGGATAARNQPEDDLFLSLYGAQNLTHTLATARKFVFRKAMPVHVHEIKSEEPVRNKEKEWLPTWKDENIKVWAMPIKPGQGEKEVEKHPVSPRNPRKRSFDQANAVEVPTANRFTESDRQLQEQHDQITRGVVADMFGSKWRLDTLVETPLNEVKLPAKLWIRNPHTKDLEEYTGPMPGGSEPLPNPVPTIFVRKPWPGALITSLPPTSPNKTSISYIIVNHDRRGKFDVKAAERLNIKEKPLYGKLTQGLSVKNADGQVVTPDMVMGPDEPGNGVAVVDLPTLDYVESLISRDEWNAPEITEHLGAIIWILGPNVAANPLLQQFMEKTGHIKHVISSPDHCPNQLTMDGAAESAIRLAQIDMAHFPIPYHDNKTLPQTSLRASKEPFQALPKFATVAQRGQSIQLDPVLALQNKTIIPPLNTGSVIRDSDSRGIMDLALASEKTLQEPEKAKEIEEWISQLPMPDVEITTLGTGSALPSKHRNVSATLVRVPGYGSYLLDAGENTLGQLQRVFNPKELEALLKDLRVIWISHLHADHHLGTVSVIKAWHQVVHGTNSKVPPVSPAILQGLNTDARETAPDERPKYLAVISDINMLSYLSEYSSVEDFGYEHVLPLFITSTLHPMRGPSKLSIVHKDCQQTDIPMTLFPVLLGIRNIQSVFVVHCHGAKAVAITFPFSNSSTGNSKVPFKVSYSGDCRPSNNFVDIGIDSTVLIHEATFEDELRGEAMAKKHSTVSEALGVGSLMRAKSVVLTHFSQRYSKIPVLEDFWGDRSKVEAQIKGAQERQERLAGIEGDFEMDGIDDEEVGLLEGRDGELLGGEEIERDHDEAIETVFSTRPAPTREELGADEEDSEPKQQQQHAMKVVVAFDYMRVKLRDIPKLEALRPALAKLFEDDIGSETSKKHMEKKRENDAKNDKPKPERTGSLSKRDRRRIDPAVRKKAEEERKEEEDEKMRAQG